MHDIYYGTDVPPNRKPIQMTEPHQRIGEPYLRCDPSKVIAVVKPTSPTATRCTPRLTTRPTALPVTSSPLLQQEVKTAACPPTCCRRSRAGNIANAVLAGLNAGFFETSPPTPKCCRTACDMLRSGKLASARPQPCRCAPPRCRTSTTASISTKSHRAAPAGDQQPPELIRRMGLIAMNGMIEADIYGNVNSTHIMGLAIMNGTGLSDFARNAFLSIFVDPSLAGRRHLLHRAHVASHVDPHRARRRFWSPSKARPTQVGTRPQRAENHH